MVVFSHIKQSLPPAQLWKEKKLTKRQVDYSLMKLKHASLIEKVSYGVWKALAENLPEERSHKEGQETPHVALVHSHPKGTKPDSVRAHGIVMTISIPRIANWDKREELLSQLDPATGLPFMPFKRIPQGQRVFFEGCKIWLCDRSIVVYYPKKHSWFAETAPSAWNAILYDTVTIIKKLESRLKVGYGGFRTGKGYRIRPSRNHYSLIKNALARQYNDEKRKLAVHDDNGLWLVIDNSFNLEELETLHPKTGLEDNLKVQRFFNGIKSGEFDHTQVNHDLQLAGSLIKEMAQQVGGVSNNQESFSRNMLDYGEKIAIHTQSIGQLGDGVEKLGAGIEKLISLVEKLDKSLEKPKSRPLRRLAQRSVRDFL